MDDDWGSPYFRKPPYICIYICIYIYTYIYIHIYIYIYRYQQKTVLVSINLAYNQRSKFYKMAMLKLRQTVINKTLCFQDIFHSDQYN